MASAIHSPDLDDSLWRTDIQNNLSQLTKNIGNLDGVLIHLLENNFISDNESETIEKQPTSLKQNLKLLQTLKKKGWHGIKPNFLKILRQTNNDYCANIIESSSADHPRCSSQSQQLNEVQNTTEDNVTKLLKSKWWPEQKILPNSFYERKAENELLTHKLKNLLTQNENKTTVINQKVAVSGLGGVGKSTTAKWFGHQYENDYEIILWIDCGEGSLIKSFTNLARDLNVKDRKELELKQLAKGCFEILEERKCLLIYDNAECYVGVEGIRDVLPNNNDNFHIIITSRNREWGNVTGYGRIPELQMDVFEKSEALDFMSNNVDSLINKDKSQLEKICELLGNLPLALQIAVAALNRSLISLPQYIETLKNTEEILVTTVDDYEKTINRTMQTSLDIIRKSEKNIGGLAYEILFIFGFITPDDVELDFFKSVKKERTGPEIYAAAKLLASYSLVTHKRIDVDHFDRFMRQNNRSNLAERRHKTMMTKNENEYFFTEERFSIHRLLQQVIRHNSADKRTEILKSILNCKGFLENKLIPYSYADKKLKDIFPKIKAELIDKLELQNLLGERKFEEAVELSRLIKDTLKDFKSHYNYALCLKYNNEVEFAIQNFEKVIEFANEVIFAGRKLSHCFHKFGIIESTYELSMEVVGGLLLLLYYCLNMEEEANQLFTSRTVMFPCKDMNQISLTLSMIWNIIPKASGQFNFDGNKNCWEINKECKDSFKKIEMSNCVLNEDFQLKQLPTDLEKLSLIRVKLLEEGDKCSAKELYLTETHFLKSIQLTNIVEMTITRSEVNIDILPECLQKLKLDECVIVVDFLSSSSLTQQPLPCLQELTLSRIQTMGDSYEHSIKPINISRLLSPKLVLIEASHYWNETSMPKVLNVPINCLQLIKHLALESCNLVCTDGIRIAPQSLKLVHVKIIDFNESDLSHTLLNDFFDLSNMQSLYLVDMSIDLCHSVSINTVELRGTKVFNWKNSNCYINQLYLHDIDVVEQTEMTIKEMTIYRSLVHISRLPQSLEILHLSECTTPTLGLFSADGDQFPRLHKLILFGVKVEHVFDNTQAITAPFRLPCYLNELSIHCSYSTSFTIELFELLRISNLNLQKCNLIYAPSIILNPKVLILNKVNIIEPSTNYVVNSIPINEFVCFAQTEVLKIDGMSIDFAESEKVSSVSLLDTELINWGNGKWCIHKLRIWPAPRPTTMIINHQECKKELFLTSDFDDNIT